MAIKVPVYEQQVRPTLSAIAPPGEDLFRAQRQLGNTIQGLGELMQQRALELQEEKDTQQVSEMLTNFRKDLDAIEFSKEVDADGKPAGIMERTLNHADGATIEYDRRVEEKKREYLSRLPGENQRLQFERLAQNHYLARRDAVIKHEANQRRAARAKTLADSFNQTMAELLRNPTLENLVRLGADYTAQLDVFMVQDGYDEKSRDLKKRQVLGQLAEAAIKKALEVNNDTAAAQKIREEFKEALATLPPEEAVKLEAEIKDAAFAETMENEWAKKYSGKDFLLSDGSPDYDKIQEDLSKTYTGEQFEKAWKYQSGKADEAYKIRLNEQEAKDRSFKNDVITFYKSGGSLRDALKKAKVYGYDPTDVLAKEEYIYRLYGVDKTGAGGSKQSVPSVYIQLWEGIQDGKVPRDQIDAAFNGGMLSQSDWENLRKDYYRVKRDGATEEEKLATRYLNLKADEKYGKKEKDKDRFKYVVQQKIKGKTLEEATAIIDEQMQKVDTGWFGWGGRERWKKEYELEDAQNLAWGRHYNALGGREVVETIGASLAIKNGRKTTITDIDQFIAAIGGAKVLKPDSKQMRAIRFLISNGKPVTPEYVKMIVDYYKGNIPM